MKDSQDGHTARVCTPIVQGIAFVLLATFGIANCMREGPTELKRYI